MITNKTLRVVFLESKYFYLLLTNKIYYFIDKKKYNIYKYKKLRAMIALKYYECDFFIFTNSFLNIIRKIFSSV